VAAADDPVKVGDRIGRLVIIEQLYARSFRVHCDCGNRREVFASQLLRGYRSCGCLLRRRRELWPERVVYWPTEKATLRPSIGDVSVAAAASGSTC
jgi:hypothetical protein